MQAEWDAGQLRVYGFVTTYDDCHIMACDCHTCCMLNLTVPFTAETVAPALLQ
jgi:hypothetical protein